MQANVQLFAGLKDAVGEERVGLDLAEGATLTDLWAALEAAHPAAEPYRGRVAFAVENQLVAPDTTVADSAEVAILPPVSGG